MKMYIGDADFLYKCCTRNCNEFELMELIPYWEFEKAIEADQIIVVGGIAYFRSFDVIMKHVNKFKGENFVLNLGCSVKDLQQTFNKWEAERDTDKSPIYF